MSVRTTMVAFAFVAVSFALSVWIEGCAASVGTRATPSRATVPVQFKIVVPKPAAFKRRPAYISPSTESATISAEPGDESTTVNCTTACSGTIAAPVGTDTFTVSLYDAFNGDGNLLSTGATTQTIIGGQANNVNVTFNGVVAFLQVSLTPSGATSGAAATIAVTTSALDADDNVIIGPGVFSDANGNPLTLTLADSDTSGATTLSPTTSLTAPTTGITLSYNGATIPSPSITLSGTGLSNAQAALIITAPTAPPNATITEFTSGITADSTPWGITAGPDGNLWFTESNASQVARITTAGAVTEFSAGITANSYPGEITLGSDHNLWFPEFGPGGGAIPNIARVTPAGVVTEFASGTTSNSALTGIAAGSDGNLWFTDNVGNIGRMTTAGAATVYSTVAASGGETYGGAPEDIAAGPDGNLWFTMPENGNQIGKITTAGVITVYSSGISANAMPWGITKGPDGNVWFTEANGNRIGRITTSGSVTEFSAGISANSMPWEITAGPDGNLYFTERSGNRIGRITTAGVVTELFSGIISNSMPNGISSGPDGNIWFVGNDCSCVGRLTL